MAHARVQTPVSLSSLGLHSSNILQDHQTASPEIRHTSSGFYDRDPCLRSDILRTAGSQDRSEAQADE